MLYTICLFVFETFISETFFCSAVVPKRKKAVQQSKLLVKTSNIMSQVVDDMRGRGNENPISN